MNRELSAKASDEKENYNTRQRKRFSEPQINLRENRKKAESGEESKREFSLMVDSTVCTQFLSSVKSTKRVKCWCELLLLLGS